jgi:ubiquinone/menaquinone biosynthesis C-methylase UbiE
MDWTRCAVNFARALASDLGSGVENVVGNAVALPFADRAFDMIFSLGMLEHQPPERQLGIVREMSRVARTAVVLSVPNVDSPIFLAMEEREHTSIPAGLIYPEQNVQHGVDLERLAQLASLRVAESAAVHIVPPRRIPGRLLSKDSHRFFSRTIDEASRSWCGNAIQTWQRVEQNCSLEEKRRFGWFSYVVALTNESGG